MDSPVRHLFDCEQMFDFKDARWTGLSGGYRMPFDPRPLLTELEANPNSSTLWSRLIEELYHQGDVGEASYAAVPHLVRISLASETLEWQPLTLVATIELAQGKPTNPPIPEWLRNDYMEAIQVLAAKSIEMLAKVTDIDRLRPMLSIICLSKDLRVYGEALLENSEDELKEFLP
jgi:hypothetical protein